MTAPNLIAEVLGKDTEVEKSVEGVYSHFNIVSAPPHSSLAWLPCTQLSGLRRRSCCMPRPSPTSSPAPRTRTGAWCARVSRPPSASRTSGEVCCWWGSLLAAGGACAGTALGNSTQAGLWARGGREPAAGEQAGRSRGRRGRHGQRGAARDPGRHRPRGLWERLCRHGQPGRPARQRRL